MRTRERGGHSYRWLAEEKKKREIRRELSILLVYF
jgi:hypothetical protein